MGHDNLPVPSTRLTRDRPGRIASNEATNMMIKTAFTRWAIPLNQQVGNLIGQTVSQSRFNQILQFYVKQNVEKGEET